MDVASDVPSTELLLNFWPDIRILMPLPCSKGWSTPNRGIKDFAFLCDPLLIMRGLVAQGRPPTCKCTGLANTSNLVLPARLVLRKTNAPRPISARSEPGLVEKTVELAQDVLQSVDAGLYKILNTHS